MYLLMKVIEVLIAIRIKSTALQLLAMYSVSVAIHNREFQAVTIE